MLSPGVKMFAKNSVMLFLSLAPLSSELRKLKNLFCAIILAYLVYLLHAITILQHYPEPYAFYLTT